MTVPEMDAMMGVGAEFRAWLDAYHAARVGCPILTFAELRGAYEGRFSYAEAAADNDSLARTARAS